VKKEDEKEEEVEEEEEKDENKKKEEKRKEKNSCLCSRSSPSRSVVFPPCKVFTLFQHKKKRNKNTIQ